MIKSLKHAGIRPRVSLTGNGFISFCVCCGDILLGLEVCDELCANLAW